MLVRQSEKKIVIHDWTSKPSATHIKKGDRYVEVLKARNPGYSIEYTEGYWRDLEEFWEALAKDGTLYFPSETKPK